jgi:hypothetical protein
MIKNRIYWLSCKVPFILFRYKYNFNFAKRISKNIQITNFVKIRPVEAQLFHTGTRTGKHDEANSRLSQMCRSTEETEEINK